MYLYIYISIIIIIIHHLYLFIHPWSLAYFTQEIARNQLLFQSDGSNKHCPLEVSVVPSFNSNCIHSAAAYLSLIGIGVLSVDSSICLDVLEGLVPCSPCCQICRSNRPAAVRSDQLNAMIHGT